MISKRAISEAEDPTRFMPGDEEGNVIVWDVSDLVSTEVKCAHKHW